MHSVPLTLNAFVLASTAIATGPTVATAARRSDSLPNAILTTLVADAPELFLLYWHDDCYIHGRGMYINSMQNERYYHLCLKAVTALCVNSTIINHIFQCSIGISTTASMVTIGHLINSTHIVKMLYMYIKQDVVV